MQNKIPFHRPHTGDNELRYMTEALRGGHLAGDGPFTKKCHGLLESVLGVRKALLTTSCTDALEMAALLVGIRPGDEVIVPSFTFVSTINAFVLRGARPVFIDIRPDTLNMNEALLDNLITPKTKAIVVMHYAGIACEMDRILEIGARRKVVVIEDNTHGLLSKYRGSFLGTFGALATQSFHETKNFTCGEGGALLINDSTYSERAEIIRKKGTNRNHFLRSQVDKYSWVDVGSSFLPSDILAACLYAQLEARHEIQRQRHDIWDRYHNGLLTWARQNSVQLPTIPEHCENPYHLFYLLMPSPEDRTRLLQTLQQKEITATFHYLPLHLSEMGRRFGGKVGDCPVTESVSDRLLRLPLFIDLTTSDQVRVLEEVTAFSTRSKRYAA